MSKKLDGQVAVVTGASKGMTSTAFIHMLPPYLAAGAGAEMRRSLGTAVLRGAFGVTLFGL